MNAPDVAEKRQKWAETISQYPPEKLVFLDESGINTNMTRIYGRALCGARAVDKAPLNIPANTTILSSIRLNSSTSYTTYSGGTTGDRFVDYLSKKLLPNLNNGYIIVMDNMRSHHVKAVKEVIENAGMNLIYLPPYSPDFNPIENMWSKIKSILRKLKIRNSDQIPTAIDNAFKAVSVSDCKGWFSNCLIT